MTDLDRPAFAQTMNRLSVALRQHDPDAVQMRVYFEALKPFSVEAIEASALAITQRGVMDERGEYRRGFFPTTAQWYDAAQVAMRDFLRKALPPARSEPWHHTCDVCEDTGWALDECRGDETCGRARVHAPHGYARACLCRPTNETFARHQRFGSGS